MVNKRGVTSVFLVTVLGAMISLAAAMTMVTADKCAKGFATAAGHLAGRSILAEYDLKLKEKYGIIAYYGDPNEMDRKLNFYTNYSLKNSKLIRSAELDSSLKEGCLMDCELFLDEISSYGGRHFADGAADALTSGSDDGAGSGAGSGSGGSSGHAGSGSGGSSSAGAGAGASEGPGGSGDHDAGRERVLRDGSVIAALPSYGHSAAGSNITGLISTLKEISGVSDLFRYGSKDFLTNVYLAELFNRKGTIVNQEDTFFKYEWEYVLEGTYDDEKNMKKVKTNIILLRTALNSLYLYQDEEKRASVEAAAALITPGPEAALTEIALTELWAAAEADNDYKILGKGKKVPVFKDDASWAIDLDSVIDGKTEGYFEPETYKGIEYDDYLKIFLYTMDRNTKLLRIMDLIQINMQGTYWKGFYIRDYYKALDFNEKINGRTYMFHEEY